MLTTCMGTYVCNTQTHTHTHKDTINTRACAQKYMRMHMQLLV